MSEHVYCRHGIDLPFDTNGELTEERPDEKRTKQVQTPEHETEMAWWFETHTNVFTSIQLDPVHIPL